MKSHSRLCGAWPALLAGLLCLSASPVLAQNSQSSQSGAKSGPPPAQQAEPPADSYVASQVSAYPTNTSGDTDAPNASSAQPPLALAEYEDGLRLPGRGDFRKQLYYGLSLAMAYSNDYSGVGSPSQVFSMMSPYLGLVLPTRTGSFVLQYNAVLSPHDENVRGGGPEAYHQFSLTGQGVWTRRWSWKLVGNGGYGSEALRLEGPLMFSVVGTIPVLNVGSTVLLPATNILFVSDSGQLVFRKNERNSFTFTLNHTYTGINGDVNNPKLAEDHLSTAEVKVDYTHWFSPRLALTTYGEQETLLGSTLCSGYGAGLGISAHLSPLVSFEAAAGPQFTSDGCGGAKSGDFSAAITGHLNQKDRVYAKVSRMLSAEFQVRPTWQNTVAGGFSKSLGKSILSTDAGFVRETFIGLPAYQGFFVAPRLHVKIGNGLGLSTGYRAFWLTGGALPKGNLNLATVSLDWYPAGLRLK
jgi:hypothetical protein